MFGVAIAPAEDRDEEIGSTISQVRGLPLAIWKRVAADSDDELMDETEISSAELCNIQKGTL